MPFKTLAVLYGTNNSYLDVTDAVFAQCIHNNTLNIPATDNERAAIFGDPLPGILKHIKIEYEGVPTIFPSGQKITLSENAQDEPFDPEERLAAIHRRLQFHGGNIADEYPEQVMSVIFIKPSNKVLEIGANIGRNTLVIASLLSNPANLVTLECGAEAYEMLCVNRDANNLPFQAENAALTSHKLYQKAWDTFPEGHQPPDAVQVPTIDWPSFKAKYPIDFDTLVADCEGALYYILQEFPDMMSNIKLVIMENDYHDYSHMEYVDHVLRTNKFKRVLSRGGGWGPCAKRFYEVWAK